MLFKLIILGALLLSNTASILEAGEKISRDGMVLIPAGTFQMGAEGKQGYKTCMEINETCKEKWFSDEKPVHSVKLDAFHIDTHETTQKEYQRVMGKNPSEFTGANRPVENVTWFQAKEYCEKTGKRLPTEAEWERAARGGNNNIFWWGDKAESGKANFCDAQCKKGWKAKQFSDGFAHTAPVGKFPPNGFGLFDMSGNVYEWVSDWHDEDYYKNSPKENPQGPKKGKKKLMRGGSWINYPTGTRPADRTDSKPNARMDFAGFRCAL